VELLRQSLKYRPSALRVLVLAKPDSFVEIRGTNLGRVDCFLLASEAAEHLRRAIEDGLVKREILRTKMLSGALEVPAIYSQHIDELERVLDERQLHFVYQPIIDTRKRAVAAYEALCRCGNPAFRDPVALIEAAVQSGNVWRLGRLVREVATEPLPRLGDGVMLFVNLHPAEIDDPQLRLLGSIPTELACRVVFEITERAAIPDFRRFQETMGVLRSAGYRFAVDDLGAGYASLNSVALLGPDFIKIDMTLVRGIQASLRRVRLISRIIDYANDEGIRVVAEGVETAEEAETIAGLGCHLMQGYYFGRPAPLPAEAPASGAAR
jgi:EAL domain-containing protein (putative c-di-GMP-specific phosphodiesterase class I)